MVEYRIWANGRVAEVPDLPHEDIPEDPIVAHGLLLMELEHWHCRWIVGKDLDGEAHYCGQMRAGRHTGTGRMYCEEHRKRATLPVFPFDPGDILIDVIKPLRAISKKQALDLIGGNTGDFWIREAA